MTLAPATPRRITPAKCLAPWRHSTSSGSARTVSARLKRPWRGQRAGSRAGCSLTEIKVGVGVALLMARRGCLSDGGIHSRLARVANLLLDPWPHQCYSENQWCLRCQVSLFRSRSRLSLISVFNGNKKLDCRRRMNDLQSPGSKGAGLLT